MVKYSSDLKDLPGEVWKDIKGFEGKYQVSNKGRVKSLDRWFTKTNGATIFYPGKILRLDTSGGKKVYIQNCKVCLCLGYMKDKKHAATKNFVINRLVAEAFIPNPNNLEIVLHKDGDITNNCVENLQWVNIKEHRDHERFTLGRELGTKPIKMMCIETGKVYESLAKLAEEFGLRSCTSLIALSKGCYVSSKYRKPNPDMVWHGYHWKVVK